MKCCFNIILILLVVMTKTILTMNTNSKDPFATLGIPEINTKDLLKEIDEKNTAEKKPTSPKLKSIDDLPNFLKSSNLNEDEGINILTRFLIQDDFTLKKYGVVYDQTGFDGIATGESLAPIGTEERLTQRARSAANIFVRLYFNKISLRKSLTRMTMMRMGLRVSLMKLYQIGGFIKS
jgi:hypothetical protein